MTALRTAALRLHNVTGKHRNPRVQEARAAVRSALTREDVDVALLRDPGSRIAALEGAMRRLLVDNTDWIDDAADQARKPEEHGHGPMALCVAIEHARSVLDVGGAS